MRITSNNHRWEDQILNVKGLWPNFSCCITMIKRHMLYFLANKWGVHVSQLDSGVGSFTWWAKWWSFVLWVIHHSWSTVQSKREKNKIKTCSVGPTTKNTFSFLSLLLWAVHRLWWTYWKNKELKSESLSWNKERFVDRINRIMVGVCSPPIGDERSIFTCSILFSNE